MKRPEINKKEAGYGPFKKVFKTIFWRRLHEATIQSSDNFLSLSFFCSLALLKVKSAIVNLTEKRFPILSLNYWSIFYLGCLFVAEQTMLGLLVVMIFGQCDQTDTLYFNIWPFATMNFCPMLYKICLIAQNYAK